MIHVVAAVISDAEGRILVSRRPDHVHQGGCWEFPGGKVEPGESAVAALDRELEEELGIRPLAAEPLIRVPWHYPDKAVLLDVWRVCRHAGEAHGREGQPVCWVTPGELPGLRFPPANRPIVAAAALPDRYLITPEPGDDHAAFLRGVDAALASGIRLLQLRAHDQSPSGYQRLAAAVRERSVAAGARLLLNAPPELARSLGVGVHLTAAALAATTERPLPPDLPVAASCHSPEELARAVDVGADFAVLGPVAATASHPGRRPLGLERYAQWIRDLPLPVYALGGMTPADLPAVRSRRGQGIAAITGLWPSPPGETAGPACAGRH